MHMKKAILQLGIFAIFLFTYFVTLRAQQYTWKEIARPTNYRLYTYSIEFVDALRGWCAAKDPVYRTMDGGKTWKGIHGPRDANFTDLSFADQWNGWAVGNFALVAGLIWRTNDGGITWVEQVPPQVNRRYWATAAQSMTHNTTVGDIFLHADTGLTMQTINGGSNWQERILADSIAAITDINFTDPFFGWAMARLRNEKGIILRTVDGGRTWGVLKTLGYSFIALSFIDSLRGWAIGGGWVHSTQDGGLTWQVTGLSPPPRFYVCTLSFVDSLNGWTFGTRVESSVETGAIYHSKDGGKSWSSNLVGVFGYITDAKMLDQFHGWAVSYDGAVLAYLPATAVAERIQPIPPPAFHSNLIILIPSIPPRKFTSLCQMKKK